MAVASDRSIDSDVELFADNYDKLRRNVELFIQGKGAVVQDALVCLFAEGHLLIEDVPGVGKTSLAKAIALSIAGTLKRIQFTPDLLPSDVTGVQVYNQKVHEFVFHEGPVFANIVVADEINRASPKTQAALLEVMEEHRVTVDAESIPVPRPFMVVATQNPVELDGTYRLPEAQVDRFLMKLHMDYPSFEAERAVLANRVRGAKTEDLPTVLTADEVARMIDTTHRVHMSEALNDYIVRLCRATRGLPDLRLGVSPRGTIALGLAARAKAASRGRSYVTAEDVKSLVRPVLVHRMLLTPDAQLRGLSADDLIDQLTRDIDVPRDRAE